MSQLPVLFPFQEEGVRFALDRYGTLIADEMGLGKTVQAISVINEDPSIQKVIIVCPASMRIPWRRELEKWLNRSLSIGIIGVDNGFSPEEFCVVKDIVIINYDRLSRFTEKFSTIAYDLCVLDECHYAKSLEARRTRAALGIKARRRIALSGTPLLNRPIEIYPVLSWLSPQEWPQNRWFDFAQRYCGAYYNAFGWDVSGASNLVELSARLRSTLMIRRTKAQVLPELPSKIRTIVELYPHRAEMKRLLKAELKAFETRFLRVDHNAIDWDDLAALRHETALAKVPMVVDYASELLETGAGKLVIFAHHRDVIAQLKDGLSKYRPVILVGGMSPQARQDSIDVFQGDPSVRVFIGNIQAAGSGITLAPASSVCLFAELSWVPAEISQCEDRLHRIGTIASITVQHLVLEGSLDAIMVMVIIKKQRILDAVLEDAAPSPQ
jgi:SWI/SNF-related matrix-associated actin-dependent regulator 1 of chromatin subfamily A